MTLGEPDDSAPVLALTGVERVFPGTPPVRALRGIDLSVQRGEYVAIIGPSGSGKSTLLNLLGLLDHPTAGSYHLDGVDTAELGEKRRTALRGSRIGFVFQAFHLLPYRTALENVVLAQVYNRTPRAQRRPRALDALTRVGLGHRLHAVPTTLSGGERQRVAVARALVTRPSLLLCDEPTGNLDSVTAEAVLKLFDGLHEDGQTIVVITHDPQVAARAQRIVAILDGSLSEVSRMDARA